MVAVGMSLMPTNVIGKEACLLAKGSFELSKDLGLKRRSNT
jgi:hypothetical protein